MKEQVMIYEVKSSADKNAKKLFSPDKEYFYWNDFTFKNLTISDYVFVVNNTSKFVLFSILDKKDIEARQNDGKTTFSDAQIDYEVDGTFNRFVRLKILLKINTPDVWNWKTLGSSETTYLNGSRINPGKSENRTSNINSLKELSLDQQYQEVLDGCLNNFSENPLHKEIIEAVKSEYIQSLLSETDFHFEKGQIIYNEFESNSESRPGLFNDLLLKFESTGNNFIDFLKSYHLLSDEYKILHLVGKVISYCDLSAAGKNELNEYTDKRTLAKSFVRQTVWVKELLKFKANNNKNEILVPSVKNALQYLKDPSTQVTMLSENHRAMVSRVLLKENKYQQDRFVDSLVNYFDRYKLLPQNPKNSTLIITSILYVPAVKKLWFEKIEGLVALDSMKWKERYIDLLKSHDYIILWWHRSPTNKHKANKLLRETINQNGYFHFYIGEGNKAIYRATVNDFTYNDEYESKKWGERGKVAELESDFVNYKDETGKSAKIAFLVSEFLRLPNAIPFEKFEFYDCDPPQRVNLQPFSEVIIDLTESGEFELCRMSPKEIIQHAHNYILGKGFRYSYEEISNFYLSLCAKPFVILAGISGTGKTQLPRKFAEALGFDNEQVIQVPVRPDWTDASDLLGYTSLEGQFIAKDLTLAIKRANTFPDKPFFFILDEMNLARVEHYFSDFLSIIETRKREGNKIVTDKIIREEMLFGASNKTEYAGIDWPQNIFLIGTVNMDETTHAFSRKVLDRANSIEMNEVDLSWIEPQGNEVLSLTGITNSFLRTPYISSIELSSDERNSIIQKIDVLKKINEILQEADLHFAYRVRDEIAFYLILNKKLELMNEDEAFDFQLVQKILPRIHGSSERIQKVLVRLYNLLEGTDYRITDFEYSLVEDKIDLLNLKYKRASRKILFMLKRYDDDRFTSFWL